MAIKKVYDLSVDLKRTRIKANVPVLVQGDSTEFRLRLLENGKELTPGQISGVTSVELLSGYDAQTIIRTVGAMQGSEAVFSIEQGELFKTGQVKAMVRLADGDDRISTLNFEYQVISDLTANYIPGEQDVSIFQQYIADAQQKIDEMAATDVQQLSTQLADKASIEKLERASIPNQVDYVKELQKLGSHQQKMNVQIVQEASKVTNVNIPLSGSRAVTYEFFKNGNDDYMMMLDGSIGARNDVDAISGSEDASLNGTFITDFPPNMHTVTVGDTISFPEYFVGTRIDFNTVRDSRGGLWRFTLDAGTANEQTKDVSVYSSGSLTTTAITLFSGLEQKKHTLTGEFLGADPANPVTSPRGWFKLSGYRPQDILKTFDVYNEVFNVNKETQAIYSYSNKEYAIEARPAGSTDAFHYIPEHSATGTAFNLQPTKLLADGKPVSFRAGTYTFDVETVQLIQKVKGVYPGQEANPLMEIATYHTIKDGVVTISGKIKFLRDTEIKTGYAMMFPYFAQFADKIKTSRGNEYVVIQDQANYKEYWEESDKSLSYIIVNDTDDAKKKVAAAMTIDNFSRTMREGETGRGEPFSWIEHRSSNLGKLYFQQFSNTTIPAGHEYRFDGRFIATEIDDISSFVL